MMNLIRKIRNRSRRPVITEIVAISILGVYCLAWLVYDWRFIILIMPAILLGAVLAIFVLRHRLTVYRKRDLKPLFKPVKIKDKFGRIIGEWPDLALRPTAKVKYKRVIDYHNEHPDLSNETIAEDLNLSVETIYDALRAHRSGRLDK